MKLWIDGYREPPARRNGWTWVKTYEEAQELLKTGEVEVIDVCYYFTKVEDPFGEEFAHTIRHSVSNYRDYEFPEMENHLEETGVDLVAWLEQQVYASGSFKVPKMISCHDMFESAAYRIRQMAKKMGSNSDYQY